MIIKKLTSDNIDEIVFSVVDAIKKGGIAVLPFDTVYGFVSDPKNDQAIEQIYSLKRRDQNKPIGLAVGSLQTLENIAGIRDDQFIQSHIPGPYSFILQAKDIDYSRFCINNSKILVRVPDSKFIRQICLNFGGPIAQTSANIAGETDCGSYQDFLAQFGEEERAKIDIFIDNGKIPNPKPSVIFDLTGDKPEQIDR